MDRARQSTIATTGGVNGGVWRIIFEALAEECGEALVFIDASIVKAHRAAAGSKKGNWKKVLAAHEEVAQVRFMQL